MRRLRTPLLGPALALIAVIFLSPSFSAAQLQPEAVHAPTEHSAAAAASFFSKLRDLLTILWADTGSGLDPNG
jgi:hypothetical protein